MSDRIDVDGSVNPVTRKLRVGGLESFESKPVFADGILRVVRLEMFARYWMGPFRIKQFRAWFHTKSSNGCAVSFA